jgi:hypothetical protein
MKQIIISGIVVAVFAGGIAIFLSTKSSDVPNQNQQIEESIPNIPTNQEESAKEESIPSTPTDQEEPKKEDDVEKNTIVQQPVSIGLLLAEATSHYRQLKGFRAGYEIQSTLVEGGDLPDTHQYEVREKRGDRLASVFFRDAVTSGEGFEKKVGGDIESSAYHFFDKQELAITCSGSKYSCEKKDSGILSLAERLMSPIGNEASTLSSLLYDAVITVTYKGSKEVSYNYALVSDLNQTEIQGGTRKTSVCDIVRVEFNFPELVAFEDSTVKNPFDDPSINPQESKWVNEFCFDRDTGLLLVAETDFLAVDKDSSRFHIIMKRTIDTFANYNGLNPGELGFPEEVLNL